MADNRGGEGGGGGMDLADFLGPAAKFLAKTGAIEKLILSLSEEERTEFMAALSLKLCFQCGRTGAPPSCGHGTFPKTGTFAGKASKSR